jgi:hypothetical protein
MYHFFVLFNAFRQGKLSIFLFINHCGFITRVLAQQFGRICPTFVHARYHPHRPLLYNFYNDMKQKRWVQCRWLRTGPSTDGNQRSKPQPNCGNLLGRKRCPLNLHNASRTRRNRSRRTSRCRQRYSGGNGERPLGKFVGCD